MPFITATSDNFVGYMWLAIGLFVLTVIVAVNIREWVRPRKIGHRFRRFFGKGLKKLEPHEKTFPGYDLASLSRALADFLADCAASSELLGSVSTTNTLRDLLSVEENNWHTRQKPSPVSHERLPVDVDVEESFVTKCLYFAVLKSVGGAAAGAAPAGERVAILLAKAPAAASEFEEDMESHAAPSSSALTLGIAARSRAVADFFFHQIEERRRARSVYRGKVIDPVINNAGIQTIAFRKIQPVAETDLILPESVRTLLHGAVVSFYQHQDSLRSLGVELKRGILFHSPPGTGKTSISLYLAGLLPNFTVCFISGKRLLYPREVCRMARYLQPAMLVFEDIDLIAQERDLNGLATVLGELMNQIDGCEPNEQVLFIMNTNSMERIEQAVRNRPGRVDQIIHIPFPDARDRRRLLELFAARFAPGPAELDEVAAATDGATPAMLKEIVKRAAVSAVAQARDNQNGNGAAATTPIKITAQDLLLAYRQVQFMREAPTSAAQIL
jgi:hypothetical protein